MILLSARNLFHLPAENMNVNNLFFCSHVSLYLSFKVREFLLSFGFDGEVKVVDR
jgi:hypothetical protein